MTNFAAHAISFIFHPSFIAILATYLISYHSTRSIGVSIVWTGIMALVALGIFLFEFYGIRKGFFSDFDVSKRKQRAPLFIFVLILVSAFMVSLLVFGGPTELLVGGLYILVGIIIFSFVNSKIKASVHVAGIGAFFVSMALLYGGVFYVGLVCIPLVAWSRVMLGRHTVSEVVIGGTLGVTLTVFVYVVIQYFKFI